MYNIFLNILYIFKDSMTKFLSLVSIQKLDPPTSLLFLIKSHLNFMVSCIQVKYALLRTILVY